MEKQFKPAGYNSVSPYFIVNGAQKFIDLMKAIFDATELRRYDMPTALSCTLRYNLMTL
jgi:PhnB protein